MALPVADFATGEVGIKGAPWEVNPDASNVALATEASMAILCRDMLNPPFLCCEIVKSPLPIFPHGAAIHRFADVQLPIDQDQTCADPGESPLA